ncbi:MAG: TIGR03435 family protein [Bryobacteraceae bacterium]
MMRASAIASLGVLLSGAIFGQTATSAPAFEVASVKVNTSGESRSTENVDNGRFMFHNYPMLGIIAFAYSISFDRVAGPHWLDTERYDIDATFAPGTTLTRDDLMLMVQKLLAERFHLTLHHDQKPVPVWALVLGKKGPKLQPSATESEFKTTCGRQGAQIACQCKKTTMAQLAEQLPHWVSRPLFDAPVVDQTGLSGFYDFSLSWTPTDSPDQSVEPPAMSLFDAIQDQLGLKLELRKAPVDRIIIDHIDRVPTEN